LMKCFVFVEDWKLHWLISTLGTYLEEDMGIRQKSECSCAS
jgi:hypothetical protein